MQIDIEGYEWESLQYILDNDLLKNTNQIAVEFHLLISSSQTVEKVS